MERQLFTCEILQKGIVGRKFLEYQTDQFQGIFHLNGGLRAIVAGRISHVIKVFITKLCF